MSRTLKVIVAGALALALSACGGTTTTPAPGSTSTVAGPKYAGQKLTVWIMEGTNPDSTPFFNQVKDAFKKQTGADLDVQFVPWAGGLDKFTTAIAGGTTPDVAEVGTTWTPLFADAGALVDLSERVKADKLDGDLVKGLVEAGTIDGKLYGMPWYAGVRSFIYNKDIFTKAGIDTPPANWDEIVAAVGKIKQSQPDVIPLPVAGNSPYSYLPWVWGAGGEIATESGGKWASGMSSPQAVEGLQFWTDLALKHNSSTPAAATWKETDALQAFGQGNVGMMISGSWTLGRLKQDAPDVEAKTGSFVIPAKAGGVSGSFLGGSHLGIFNNTKNEDLAWEYVKLMSTGDFAAKWAESSNFFPGQKSLLEKQQASASDVQKTFITQMVEGGKSVPATPLWGKVETRKTIPNMVTEVLTGKKDAKAAADAAAAEMNTEFGS